MDPSRIKEGLFLEFDPDELEEVREFLREQGYSPDANGLKRFIVDAVLENEDGEEKEEWEGIVGRAENFIRDNPEILKAGASIASRLFNSR